MSNSKANDNKHSTTHKHAITQLITSSTQKHTETFVQEYKSILNNI